MKKLVFAVLVTMSLSIVSCGENKSTEVTKTDSTDTTLVDTTKISSDTTLVDSTQTVK